MSSIGDSVKVDCYLCDALIISQGAYGQYSDLV